MPANRVPLRLDSLGRPPSPRNPRRPLRRPYVPRSYNIPPRLTRRSLPPLPPPTSGDAAGGGSGNLREQFVRGGAAAGGDAGLVRAEGAGAGIGAGVAVARTASPSVITVPPRPLLEQPRRSPGPIVASGRVTKRPSGSGGRLDGPRSNAFTQALREFDRQRSGGGNDRQAVIDALRVGTGQSARLPTMAATGVSGNQPESTSLPGDNRTSSSGDRVPRRRSRLRRMLDKFRRVRLR